MKKYLVSFIIVLFKSLLFSQSFIGEKFDLTIYSNTSINILNNTNVFIKIIVTHQDSIYYEEIQNKNTNNLGQISNILGEGEIKINKLKKYELENFTLTFLVSEQLNGVYRHIFSKDVSSKNNLLKCLNKHYNTGNNSELITKLPLTSGKIYQKKVIFSQKIDHLSEDDIIEVLAEFEATNNLGYNVMIASGIIITNNPENVTGIEICENNGFNITPSMHHATTNKVGTYKCTKNYYDAYINVIVYAASTKAKENDVLEINKDYGRLSVLIFSTDL